MNKITKKKLYIIIIIIIIFVLLIFYIKNNTKDLFSNNSENSDNNDIIKSFTNVYETNHWGDNNVKEYKGSSGPGSAFLYNEKTYIPFMNKFIKDYNINSVVDLGCGDFVIGLALYGHTNINYTGYDAYKTIVDFNNEKFKDNNRFNFIHSDFTSEKDRINLKPADLCVIKDVLQHLPTSIIINFMDYIIKSKKYKYILITNCYQNTPENTENSERKDIKIGDFSSLSALRHPLNMYKPKILYNWDTKEVSLIEVQNNS